MAELAQKYVSSFLSDTMRSAVIESVPKVPANLRKKPCAVGIDEAGRGPVLGAMVYSAFACCIDDVEQLRSSQVADSKTLNEEKREQVFSSLCELRSSTIWYAKVLSPAHISASMLSRTKYNLNELSQDTAALLLRKLIENGVNVRRVYVDTVGDANKYRARLASQFSDSIEFTVCPKADSLFPEVSAASICAKVLRDRCVKKWPLADGVFEPTDDDDELNYGSGYPGDPNTKAFLRSVFDPVFGFPDLVRFSWSTAYQVMLKDGVLVRWSDDEDENANGSGNSYDNARWRKRVAAPEQDANADAESGAPKRAAGRKQKPIASRQESGSLMKFLSTKGDAEVGAKKQLKNESQETKENDQVSVYKRSPEHFKSLCLSFVKKL